VSAAAMVLAWDESGHAAVGTTIRGLRT